MSRTRQVRLTGAGVFTYPAGTTVATHTHAFAQLVHAVSGVLRATTPDATWVLPPTRALLIPAHTRHGHRTPAQARMHTLHLDGIGHAGQCQLLGVTPLAGEVITALANGDVDHQHPSITAYLEVLDDQLLQAHPIDLHLPLPAEPLLHRLTDALLADIADPSTLEDWGTRVGASGRTLSRHFRAHTGLTFDQWRRRARMLHALELLAAGHTVENAAHTIGYASASSFAYAFRQLTGTTPADAIRTSRASSRPHLNEDRTRPVPVQ